jgi:NAD(P)-dependent dehydrogenase (short-subunit alcohol dehydrogenase family)
MTGAWTEVQALWRERSPMRRAATPADVADMVAALVANPYVTGEVVVLDGGLNLT